MRFLANTYNPDLPDAPRYVTRRVHETPEEAWANHKAWLEGKVIGDPKATAHYSVSELIREGMVGVYTVDGNSNNEEA